MQAMLRLATFAQPVIEVELGSAITMLIRPLAALRIQIENTATDRLRDYAEFS